MSWWWSASVSLPAATSFSKRILLRKIDHPATTFRPCPNANAQSSVTRGNQHVRQVITTFRVIARAVLFISSVVFENCRSKLSAHFNSLWTFWASTYAEKNTNFLILWLPNPSRSVINKRVSFTFKYLGNIQIMFSFSPSIDYLLILSIKVHFDYIIMRPFLTTGCWVSFKKGDNFSGHNFGPNGS